MVKYFKRFLSFFTASFVFTGLIVSFSSGLALNTNLDVAISSNSISQYERVLDNRASVMTDDDFNSIVKPDVSNPVVLDDSNHIVLPYDVDSFNSIDWSKSLLTSSPIANDFRQFYSYSDTSLTLYNTVASDIPYFYDVEFAYDHALGNYGYPSANYTFTDSSFSSVPAGSIDFVSWQEGISLDSDIANNTLLSPYPSLLGGYHRDAFSSRSSYEIDSVPAFELSLLDSYYFDLKTISAHDINSFVLAFPLSLQGQFFGNSIIINSDVPFDYDIGFNLTFIDVFDGAITYNYSFASGTSTSDFSYFWDSQFSTFTGLHSTPNVDNIVFDFYVDVKAEADFEGFIRNFDLYKSFTLSKFNVFSTSDVLSPDFDISNPIEYESCGSLNVFCHMRNASRWVVFDSFIAESLYIDVIAEIFTKSLQLASSQFELSLGWLGIDFLNLLSNLVGLTVAMGIIKRIF